MYDGYNKIFWGLVLSSFNINLGIIKILPRFVGFLIILGGISRIYEESHLDKFKTAKNWGIFMTIIVTIGEGIGFFTQGQIGYSLIGAIWTVFYISFELLFFFKLLEASIDYLKLENLEDIELEYTMKFRKYTVFTLINIVFISIALIFNLSVFNTISSIIAIILKIYLMVMIYGLRNNWDKGSDPLSQ